MKGEVSGNPKVYCGLMTRKLGLTMDNSGPLIRSALKLHFLTITDGIQMNLLGADLAMHLYHKHGWAV